jgi:hypothetical protein
LTKRPTRANIASIYLASLCIGSQRAMATHSEHRTQQKVDCEQLAAGDEFPAASYRVDSSTVAGYLSAVGGDDARYRVLVPPMAIAARAMAALSHSISFPPGAIHLSQEVETTGTASTEDTLTSHARVLRRQERGRFRILTIALSVHNQRKEQVLSGKTSFMLPEDLGAER